MEIYEQQLMDKARELSKEAAKIASEIVNLECYKIILEIKAVIEDDSLDDPECFEKIEEIITVFEKHGLGCDFRHDFG